MIKEKSVRLLQVPHMNRCCCCQELRFAIASQAMIHKPSGKTHFRWICESCGYKRGIRPTPDYLRKKWEIDREDSAEIILKVLARV